MTLNTERVISIALPDEVWRAFTQAQPEPVQWLKARIQESIDSTRAGSTPSGQPPVGRA
jgi:hypothetical protein